MAQAARAAETLYAKFQSMSLEDFKKEAATVFESLMSEISKLKADNVILKANVDFLMADYDKNKGLRLTHDLAFSYIEKVPHSDLF